MQRLRQYFDQLTEAQQRIAEFILQEPVKAVNMPVSDIAAHCHTSTSTVVRLAKDIGFEGIKQMKLALAQELGTLMPRILDAQVRDAVDDGDFTAELLDNTVLGLRETILQLDSSLLHQAADAIRKAGRVEVYGASSAHIVGTDLVEKLRRLGIAATTFANSYMQTISAAGLSHSDVAVGISYSGETRDTIETLKVARAQGATTIAMVNFVDSTLVEHADIVVPTAVTRHMFPDGSMGGRIAQLLLVDALFLKLFTLDPDRFKDAWHKYNQILLDKIRKVKPESRSVSSDSNTDRNGSTETSPFAALIRKSN